MSTTDTLQNGIDRVLIDVRCPKWFLIIFPLMLFGGLTVVALIVGIYVNRNGVTWPIVIGSGIFLAAIAVWVWLIPYLYSSIVATESGLSTTGPFRQNQHITWGEITSVGTPRFGIPKEFIYILSRSGERIVVVRSMEQYRELLDLIQIKVPTLPDGKIPEKVWGTKHSWIKTWLALAGFFAIYLAAKRYWGF